LEYKQVKKIVLDQMFTGGRCDNEHCSNSNN